MSYLDKKHTDKCEHKPIPVHGAHLAGGSDGLAYNLKSDPNRIIKIGHFPCIDHSGYAHKTVEDNFKYMKRNKPAAYVRVYDYGFVNCKHCCVSYYCVMDKLKASPKSDVISQIVSEVQYYYGSRKDDKFPLEKVSKHIAENTYWGDTRGAYDAKGNYVYPPAGMPDSYKKKVFKFLRAIWSSGVFHCDLHGGNIMEDSKGNLKMIDLDRLILPRKKVVKAKAPVKTKLPVKKNVIRPAGVKKK